MTIADVLRHESGLAFYSSPLNLEDLTTENTKENKVGKVIEDSYQVIYGKYFLCVRIIHSIIFNLCKGFPTILVRQPAALPRPDSWLHPERDLP